jgi:hypothetical protein
MTQIETYCQVLGIPSSATVEEIKKAFRQQAKRFHPDLNKDPNAAEYARPRDTNKHMYLPTFSIHWILLLAAIIIYMTIGFQTFISVFELLVVVLIFWIVFSVLLKYRSGNSIKKSIFRSLYISFLTLNGLLVLNYVVSFNSNVEVYKYECTRFASRNGSLKGSWINLLNENEQLIYENYLSIRFFWDYESIPSGDDYIVYETKLGILGFKIYKERKFAGPYIKDINYK